METLFHYLTKNFAPNTPIFVSEVNPEDMSYDSIRADLVRLCKANKISKFSFGVYYIPLETEFGKSKLSAEDVLSKKYITDGKDVYGFYSGESFLNLIGISYQVPATLSIVSNKESSGGREVQVGYLSVNVKRSYFSITKDNYKILQVIDLVNEGDITFLKKYSKSITEYASTLGKSTDDLFKILVSYPSKTAKKMIESGIINAFARR
jgi:hypothetical protein